MNAAVDMLNDFALRWWPYVLHATWQAAVVAALVLAVVKLGRRWHAPLRYWLLVVALAKFAMPPMFSMPVGLFGVLEPVSEVAVVVDQPVRLAVTPAPLQLPSVSSAAVRPRPLSWRSWLLVGQVFGCLAMAMWVSAQLLRLAGLMRRAERICDGPAHSRFLRLQRRMGFRRGVRLLFSRESMVPVAVGVVRPTVVMPHHLIEQLSPTEVDAILTHELAHLRRGDLFVNWAQITLAALWWFNPMVWLLNREIRSAREDCCDDLVVGTGVARGSTYCEMLLRAAASGTETRTQAFAALGFADSLHPLANRIKRIMTRAAAQPVRLTVWGGLLVAVVAALALPGLRAMSQGERMWLKCSNTQCGKLYESGFVDKFPTQCRHCKKETARFARKCLDCGTVFGTNGWWGRASCPACHRWRRIERVRSRQDAVASDSKTGPLVAFRPRLQFRLVAQDGDEQAADELVGPQDSTGVAPRLRVLKELLLCETNVASAVVSSSPDGGHAIELTFHSRDDRLLERVTARNIGRRLAIVFDGKVLAAPIIKERISRRAVISGTSSLAEAQRIVAGITGKEVSAPPASTAQVAAAEAQFAAAEIASRNAVQHLEGAKKLVNAGKASVPRLQDAELAHARSLAQVAAARLGVAEVKRGDTDALRLAAAEAELTAAQVALRAADTRVDYAKKKVQAGVASKVAILSAQAARAQAAADLAAAECNLAMAKGERVGTRAREVGEARLDAARLQLAASEQRHQRALKLVKIGRGSQQEYADMEAEVAQAKARVAQAQAALSPAVRPEPKAVGAAAAGTPGGSAAEAHLTHCFVRLVVGKDTLTFEGQETTLEDLEGLLVSVPNRAHTVLEIANENDELTLRRFRQVREHASRLSGKLGLSHVSEVGAQPLGSKALKWVFTGPFKIETQMPFRLAQQIEDMALKPVWIRIHRRGDGTRALVHYTWRDEASVQWRMHVDTLSAEGRVLCRNALGFVGTKVVPTERELTTNMGVGSWAKVQNASGFAVTICRVPNAVENR